MDIIGICIENIPSKVSKIHIISSAHGPFSRIDHMPGHKTSLNKFKKIEIILSTFSNYNSMRLEMNYKKKTAKKANTWRLNNMLLNNQWVTEEISEEIKKYTWRQMKTKAQ